MKIVDFNCKEIPACVTLPVDRMGAFEISLTTITKCPELRVFNKRVSGGSDDVTHLFFPNITGVPATAQNIALVVKMLGQFSDKI